ncbi:MAG: IS481 family transposase [Candidatus Hydrogenedentes bacterium]|nr:IS481 family transposase [Candidatus Hydrogenedentota bacterium]
MAWKEMDVMELRCRFVLDYQSGKWTMAELCRRYGISRPCGYKWVARYAEEGAKGLEDRSRRPQHCPHGVDKATEDVIAALRDEYPKWGARKLRAKLQEREPGRVWPASSTIGDVLSRRGLTVPRRHRRGAEPSSAEPLGEDLQANDVWSIDYKGWFRTGDGRRCDPLTLQDAASRYALRCQGLERPSYSDTRRVMQAAFREYGLPRAIRSDNGQPFASVGLGGLTRLSVWWVRLGIEPTRIRPGRPQENGRHERFHRTLKEATASPPAATIRAQQARFDRFLKEFNEERPHEALGRRPPASYYTPSPRPYPSRIAPLEYPAQMQVRSVHEHGQFRFQGVRFFLGHAFANQPIGLMAIEKRYWLVYFAHLLLGVADVNTHRILTPAQARKRVPDYESAMHYISSTVMPSPRGGHQGKDPERSAPTA